MDQVQHVLICGQSIILLAIEAAVTAGAALRVVRLEADRLLADRAGGPTDTLLQIAAIERLGTQPAGHRRQNRTGEHQSE